MYVEDGQEYAAVVVSTAPAGEACLAICAPPGSRLYTSGRTFTDEVQWKYRMGVPYDWTFRPAFTQDGQDPGVPPRDQHWRRL